MAEAATTRQRWVDVAKGVAIVMVVAYHALLFLETADVGVAPLGRARIPLELYPMPAFFLLAGVMQRRLTTSPWGLVWRRRVMPLLWLLVGWSLVRFAFFSALPMVRSDGPPGSGRDPLQLLLVPVAPVSIYWFLWSLAAVTSVTWLARRYPFASVVGAVLVSGAATSGLVVTGVLAWDRTAAFLAPYVVGVHAGPWVVRAVTAMRWRHVLLALGAAGLVLAAVVAVPLTRRVPGATLLAEAAVLAAALGAASLVSDHRWTEPLQALGRRSLPIYLLHLYPIALLTILVRSTGLLRDTPARGLPLVFLVTALALGASLLLARAVPARSRLLQAPTSLLRRRAATRPAAHGAHVPAPGSAAAGATTVTGTTVPDDAASLTASSLAPAPLDTAPLDTTPIDTAPLDTALRDTAPLDAAPAAAPARQVPVTTGSVAAVTPDAPPEDRR